MSRTLEKQSAILKAAKTLFLQKGFQSTSMDEITALAEVSKRTVYHHFPDKVSLFKAIIKLHWDEVMQKRQSKLNAEMPPEQALTAFCQDFMAFAYHVDTMSLFRLMIAEGHALPHLSDLVVAQGKAPFTQELIDYLSAQKTNGILKIEQVDLAASHLLGMLKEDQFWPKMLGFIPVIDLAKTDLLICEAVRVFLCYYRKKSA